MHVMNGLNYRLLGPGELVGCGSATKQIQQVLGLVLGITCE